MDKNTIDFQLLMEENSRLDYYLKKSAEQTDDEIRQYRNKYGSEVSSADMYDDEPAPLDLGE